MLRRVWRPTQATADQAPRSWWTPRVVGITGLTLVGLLWGATWFFFHDDQMAARGTWGDMFGGVSALFSGLAFVGLLVAIIQQREELQMQREELGLQRDELRLTRKELELTRDEIAGQRAEMERQNATIERQLFESGFVALLRLFRDSVHGIRWLDRVTDVTGPAAIEKAAHRVGVRSRHFSDTWAVEKGFEELRKQSVAHTLTGYFSSFAELLRTIEGAPGDGRRYRDMVTATLTQPEAELLMMYATTKAGSALRALAVRHAIFEAFTLPEDRRRLKVLISELETASRREEEHA